MFSSNIFMQDITFSLDHVQHGHWSAKDEVDKSSEKD